MSNETKQTAVEWLLDRIEDVDLTEKLWENVKQQAKEMEKERELNAYANGQADTLLMFKQKISKMKDIPTEFNQIISENFWDLV
jgi:chlorite dismutase